MGTLAGVPFRASARRGLACALGLLSTAFARSDARSQEAVPFAVVAHPDLPVADLTSGQLKEIFLGDRQFWSTEVRVTLLLRAPDAHERDAYVKGVCGMTEARFRQHWIGKVFRGQATSSPKLVYSNRMALQLVRLIPGAVALVDGREISAGHVKILRIDGRLPGEAGYPVH